MRKKGTWYDRHRKICLARQKKYDDAHPVAYSHERYLKQKPKRAVSQMKWYWKNRRKALKTMKAYRDRKRMDKQDLNALMGFAGKILKGIK